MPTVEPGAIQATITGTIAVLLAAACWALSGIFVKLIMVDDQVSSLTLAFWRPLKGSCQQKTPHHRKRN